MKLTHAPPPNDLLRALQALALKNCRRCGACCRESEPIEVLDHEVRAIAAYLKITYREARERYFRRDARNMLAFKIPCPFLEPGRCQIYPVRPIVCRNFPFLSAIACDEMSKGRLMLSEWCPASHDARDALLEVIDRMGLDYVPPRMAEENEGNGKKKKGN